MAVSFQVNSTYIPYSNISVRQILSSLISDSNYVIYGRGWKKGDYNKGKFYPVFIDYKRYIFAIEVRFPPQPNKTPICCAVFELYYSNL